MTPPVASGDATIRELVSRLTEDGKAYVRAEVQVARATVLGKVGAVRPVAIGAIVALLLVQAALTVLTAALGMVLATWLGLAGGMAVAAAAMIAVAALLVWIPLARLKGEPA